MIVKITQEDLSRGLNIVSRIVTNKAQLPVLANVLIEADLEGVTLTTTNLEMGMRINVGGKTEEEGKTTVPAKNLAEFVSSLPVGQVEIESKGEKVGIGKKGFWGDFLGISATEFPVMAKMSDKKGDKMKLDKDFLEKISKEVIFAAATDESRPVLTGVNIQINDNKVQFVATDGFRLCKKVIESETIGWNKTLDGGKGLIMPAKTLAEISRLVGEGRKGEVEMEILEGGNQVVFGYGNWQLMSRVLEGSFPDADKIIPKEFKTRITVDREELIKAVRAAAIFARESNNIIRLKMGEGVLGVKAVATNSGEAEIEIEAEKDGDNEEMAFNYRYMLDFLNSVSEERVVLESNGALVAGVWRPEKDTSLTHLIMPVRV